MTLFSPRSQKALILTTTLAKGRSMGRETLRLASAAFTPGGRGCSGFFLAFDVSAGVLPRSSAAVAS
jgi:hypothetical protein